MSVLNIRVQNPYTDSEYNTKDIDMGRWVNFINNHHDGHENCISFTDLKTGKHVVINPQNFASVEVKEVQSES